MAGPGCSVLLEFIPDLSLIYAIIDNIAGKRQGNDFSINTHSVFPDTSQQKSFSVELSEITPDYHGYSQEEITQIKTTTGFKPKFDVSLYAMSNDNESHKILGMLCFKIAEATNGIIDFGGQLNNLPKTLPNGKLFSIPYHTTVNDVAQYHIGDAEFLKFWLSQENFRLVK